MYDFYVYACQAKYFMDEAKDKSDKQVDTTSWTQEMVESLPQQQNGYTCFSACLHILYCLTF